MTATIKLRRDTAANWTSANPILAAGEAGIETDTKKFKVGDGVTHWNSLGYFNTVAGVTYGTPAVNLGTAAAAGSIDEAIRRDSTVVAFDATAPSTQAFGDSAVVGTAAVAARRDHKHAMPATPTSVSGNAGTATALQNSRNIDGQAFNGTADITVIAPGTHAASSKATPVDADELPLVDSAASNVLKKLTWLNLKATLKTYFDTLYTAIGASAPPNGAAGGDLTGTYPNPTLAAAGGGAAGPTGSATVTPIVTVDAKGRVTALSSATINSVANLTRSPRSSNTILAAADKGTVIAATAAYTQTLTAPATLTAGWWCIVKNDTQDGTTVLGMTAATGNIDGITGTTGLTMYSGESRLLTTDGNNFFTQLLTGGFAKFTPTGGNFIVPTGITELEVVCVGSGGQGGGGFSGSASATVTGGAGGGGGAAARAVFRASDFTAGATVVVTVPAGGSAAGAPGSPGTPGSDGGTTTFGAFLKAGGGGGGAAGASAATAGGGGGGSVVNSAVGTTAGAPVGAAVGIGAQSAPGGTSLAPSNAEWGGASGGLCTTSNVLAGGSSIYGGPAGGAGGRATTTVGQNGAAGGTTQSYAVGGGGSLGTGGGTTVKGGDGTFTGPYCGSGGGGGGGGSTGVTAKVGGAGSIGAGGGGGGASANTTGGTGGAGGPGECRVFFS